MNNDHSKTSLVDIQSSVIVFILMCVMLGAVRDNLSGFAYWGHLILIKFQNKFCACSADPGQKYEPGLMFDTNMSASFQVGDCVLL